MVNPPMTQTPNPTHWPEREGDIRRLQYMVDNAETLKLPSDFVDAFKAILSALRPAQPSEDGVRQWDETNRAYLHVKPSEDVKADDPVIADMVRRLRSSSAAFKGVRLFTADGQAVPLGNLINGADDAATLITALSAELAGVRETNQRLNRRLSKTEADWKSEIAQATDRAERGWRAYGFEFEMRRSAEADLEVARVDFERIAAMTEDRVSATLVGVHSIASEAVAKIGGLDKPANPTP